MMGKEQFLVVKVKVSWFAFQNLAIILHRDTSLSTYWKRHETSHCLRTERDM